MQRYLLIFLLCSLSSPLVQSIIRQPMFLELNGNNTGQRLLFRGNDQYRAKIELPEGQYSLRVSSEDCQFQFGADEYVILSAPTKVVPCSDSTLKVDISQTSTYTVTLNAELKTLTISPDQPLVRQPPPVQCPQPENGVVNVSAHFPNGTTLTDQLTGREFQVENGMIDASGDSLLILTLAEQGQTPWQWQGANLYFVMTDRFANGREDGAYGRLQDDAMQNIGTFHGGDLQGVIDRLDYLQELGIDAIWLTPLYEQVHGYVNGHEDKFPFYAYHGYWPRDFTKVDASFGDEETLHQLIELAHEKGMRVIMDVIMNHAGYATLADIEQLALPVLKDQQGVDVWQNWHKKVDWQSEGWQSWWGPDWIRATFPAHQPPGGDDITMSLAGLPDFLTEQSKPVASPSWVNDDAKRSVIDHLIQWNVEWIEKYGFDGLRIDTAKHIEVAHWQALKNAAVTARAQWAQNNPQDPMAETPLYMIGEVYGQGVLRNYYYDHGFDALINFDFQHKAVPYAQCLALADRTYQYYADQQVPIVSYLSSHDTQLFFDQYENFALQRGAATALALLPGAIQITYGDETARAGGPHGGDFHQATRSDMNWTQISGEREALLAHWQQLLTVRQNHPVIGLGEHIKLSDAPYAFIRQNEHDKVLVIWQ